MLSLLPPLSLPISSRSCNKQSSILLKEQSRKMAIMLSKCSAIQLQSPCRPARTAPTSERPLGATECAAVQAHPSPGCNHHPHSQPQGCPQPSRCPKPVTPHPHCHKGVPQGWDSMHACEGAHLNRLLLGPGGLNPKRKLTSPRDKGEAKRGPKYRET